MEGYAIPSQVNYNYSTARGDGLAVRASNTTITFTGPPLTSEQIGRVTIILASTLQPLIWEQGKNAVITISGSTITIYSLGGNANPVPENTVYIAVSWSSQDKAYDPATGAARSAPVTSDANRNYPIVADQSTAVGGAVTTPNYIPGGPSQRMAISIISAAGTNIKRCKLWKTDDADDTVALASRNWVDITNSVWGVAEIVIPAGAVTINTNYEISTPLTAAYFNFQVVTDAAGAADNTWVIRGSRAVAI